MTPAGAALPAWETDKAQVCARIAANRGLLKILLKTKDDPFFLPRWVRHHARIAGLRNLIIFDNMSTDPAVLELYDKSADDLQVVRFEGMHNRVHDTTLFPELYAALAKSCEYFIFLDTDEYLVLLDEQGWHDSFSLLRFIERNPDVPVFPGTWLINVAGSDSQIMVGTAPGPLVDGLRWGKPVIRASAALSGFINHNGQLDKALYGPRIPTNLFVLHLVQLSAEQRIRSNVLKLIARGFISEGESVEEIARRDPAEATDQNVRLYLSEIRRLVAQGGDRRPGGAPLAAGCIELQPEGGIGYFGEAERTMLSGFLVNPDDAAAQVLGIAGRGAAA